MNEYIIINKTNLEKRIEVLGRLRDDLLLTRRQDRDKSWDEQLQSYGDEITVLKLLLSQSKPLNPEIEKAYTHAGTMMHDRCISHNWRGVYQKVHIDRFENYKKDYINNLTI